MPCGPKCACHGTGIECLSVIDPVNFGFLSEWCDSGDDLKRRIVLGRSRIAAETGHVATSVPTLVVQVALQIPLAGDLVEAIAKRIGADRLARFVETKLGVPCGCPERQAALNRLDASLRRYLAR